MHGENRATDPERTQPLDNRWGFARARTTALGLTPVSTRELLTVLRATTLPRSATTSTNC
ncbi:hypothetical protein [Streptomyces prunicolor]|uniref:hypothetical protein n=1 Tax=Streptomyces prunicolor TaxID=67348 RepID=UPI00039FDCE0|nr:hypothetical protein [Streptomyces prunicolor]